VKASFFTIFLLFTIIASSHSTHAPVGLIFHTSPTPTLRIP
jgi:hypothetical protein